MASRRSQSGGVRSSSFQRLTDLALSGSSLHLVDSAIASSSNLLLGILVASRVSTENFGRYGAAFALYSMTFGVWRAFGPDAFLLSRTKKLSEVSATISASAWLGVVFGVLGLVVGLTISALYTTQGFLLAFAVGLPVLAVQDAVRFSLIGLGKTIHAIAMNMVWLALMVGTVWLTIDAVAVVLLWVVAALVSSVTGMCFLRWPRVAGGQSWIRSHFEDSAKFAVEFWINSVSLLVVLFAIGLFSGFAEMGAYRAAAVLVGPVAVVSNGLMTTAQLLEPARFESKELQRRLGLLLGTGLAAGLVTAALLAALPAAVGSLLLGESWAAAQPVGIPLAVCFGTLAALMATVGTLRALGQAAQGYRYRVGGLVLIGLGGTLGSLHSALAAAVGMAICGFVAMAAGLHGLWPHLSTGAERELSAAEGMN